MSVPAASGGETKELAIKVLDDDTLRKVMLEVGPVKVLKNCLALLSVREQVFKLSTIKSKLHMNKDLSVAVTVLQKARLLVVCSWKKPGSTGC